MKNTKTDTKQTDTRAAAALREQPITERETAIASFITIGIIFPGILLILSLL